MYYDPRLGIIRDVKLKQSHQCKLCELNDLQISQIKEMYMEWLSLEEIADNIELDGRSKNIIEEHAKAFAWHLQRSKNPYSFYAAYIRMYAQKIFDAVSHEPSVKNIIAASKAIESFNVRNTPKDIQRETKTIGQLVRREMAKLEGMKDANGQVLSTSAKQLIVRKSIEMLEAEMPGIRSAIESDATN